MHRDFVVKLSFIPTLMFTFLLSVNQQFDSKQTLEVYQDFFSVCKGRWKSNFNCSPLLVNSKKQVHLHSVLFSINGFSYLLKSTIKMTMIFFPVGRGADNGNCFQRTTTRRTCGSNASVGNQELQMQSQVQYYSFNSNRFCLLTVLLFVTIPGGPCMQEDPCNQVLGKFCSASQMCT